MCLQVLIVDDDTIALFLQTIVINKANLSNQPHSFLNGLEALNYLDGNTPANTSYLIFLDINMPVLNGWGFLDSIQERSYSKLLDVIVLTSSINCNDRKKAFSYPQVKDFIEKPLSLEKVEKFKHQYLEIDT